LNQILAFAEKLQSYTWLYNQTMQKLWTLSILLPYVATDRCCVFCKLASINISRCRLSL